MKKHPLLVLGILFLLFVVPLVLAYFLFYEGDTLGEGTVNRGVLIQPAIEMSALSLQAPDGSTIDQKTLRGKWLMLYVNPGQCQADCEKMLYNMRQIRTATGKDMERINRAILLFNKPSNSQLQDLIQAQYPGTEILIANQQQFQQIMAGSDTTKLALNTGYLYLVDPLGNIMMGYTITANPSDIFKDLQRLLKISQIG